jgi:hypothetical protein
VNYIFCHNPHFPRKWGGFYLIYLNRDHKQVHKYSPEKKVDIENSVDEPHRTLNILEISPFGLKFDLN